MQVSNKGPWMPTVAVPTMAQLRAAQRNVEAAVMKAGANGIGIGDAVLVIYVPRRTAAVLSRIEAVMQTQAPTIAYAIEQLGTVTAQRAKNAG